jgi:hypothetical protein
VVFGLQEPKLLLALTVAVVQAVVQAAEAVPKDVDF